MLKKYQLYIAAFAVGLIASGIGFAYTLTKLDPYTDTGTSLTAFYLTSFLFSLSFAVLIGFGLRRRFGTREMVAGHFKQSLRQAFWLAVMVTVLLILQAQRMATWTNSALLAAALIFLEFYFISNEKNISLTKN